jgi:predicted transcriptional regulator
MAKFEITWLEDLSDESVLEEIRRVAALSSGVRLTKRVFDSHARIKSSAVERRFGSWAEATRRAGLSDALPIYTEDAIVGDIQRVSALSHEDSFTLAVYSKHGQYSGSLIKRQFGGWREALVKAGLEDRYVGPHVTERMKAQVGRAMSDDEILGRIRAVAAQLGNAHISGADVEANSEITQSQMYRRFGSVSAALRKAGVEQAPHGRRYTENEVFENLLNVWTHYGRPPTVSEMDRPPSVVGPNAYIKRYGRWREALKAFIARANSEVEDGLSIKSAGEPSPAADASGSSPSVIEAINETGTPVLDRPIAVRSRAPRPASTNIQPEDRRDPSIGLRFKVLQKNHFKCVLCGDHPAAERRLRPACRSCDPLV